MALSTFDVNDMHRRLTDNMPFKVHCNILHYSCFAFNAFQINPSETNAYNMIVTIFNFFSGNDVIHQLTKGTNSSLYVEISPRRDNYTFYQVYRDFSISSEDQKYKLQLANPGNGCKTFCLVCFSTINICNAYSPLFKVIDLTQVAMFYTGTVLVKYV